jgi:hypothetical protein
VFTYTPNTSSAPELLTFDPAASGKVARHVPYGGRPCVGEQGSPSLNCTLPQRGKAAPGVSMSSSAAASSKSLGKEAAGKAAARGKH